MKPEQPTTERRLGDETTPTVARALRGDGIWLDIGGATLRVRGRSPHLPQQLRSVYRHFPFVPKADWADLHLSLDPVPGLRRWLRPQVRLIADSRIPFQPFPADHPLPMLEWGANLLLGQRFHHLLLFHAGVVEREGRALVLPALPGSGKSTLTAALSLSGWRMLSDEFGALDPHTGEFQALLKPVALKNRSIEVIRGFSSQAEIGRVFEKTRKGDVAHLAPSAHAVAQRHVAAKPGAVVLPRWLEGSQTVFRPLAEESVFRSLAFNAFNYHTLGAAGFEAVMAITRRCPAWELVYSRLDEALAALERIWPQVLERHAKPRPGA